MVLPNLKGEYETQIDSNEIHITRSDILQGQALIRGVKKCYLASPKADFPTG